MFKKIYSFFSWNIQANQSLFWLTILFVWKIFFWLTISYTQIFTVFFCTTFFDYLFNRIKTWENKFPYSWVNAWLWISFFLRSDETIIFIFAAFLAILTKYLLKVNWRHFLNPSNAAVFIILVLFWQYTWVNPLQWWNYEYHFSIYYILAILLVWTLWNIIIYRVKVFFKYTYLFDLVLPYFLLHSILFFIIPSWETWSSYYLFFGIPFFIHIFFMITDPKTVPWFAMTRFFYSINLVLSFYVVQFYINEAYSLLGALFLNTLFLPIVWYLESKNKKYASFFYLTFIFLNIIIIMLLINYYWKPDLVFNNLCNKLICR